MNEEAAKAVQLAKDGRELRGHPDHNVVHTIIATSAITIKFGIPGESWPKAMTVSEK